MSWYSSFFKENYYNKLIKTAMKRQSSAIDELWNSLNSAGITDKIGTSSKKEFEQLMREKDPSFIGKMSQESINLEDKQKEQLQKSYASFISGRVLAEEISKARQKAIAEGRQPSVAELRKARRDANERLLNEGIYGEGLGIPTQIHVGRRGPLGRIKLKPTVVPKEVITDQEIKAMANSILLEEQEKIKLMARQRFERGESNSPAPTTSEMRQAIFNANERLKEGLKFIIGTRGPLPGVSNLKLNRNIENSKEYYEWRDRQKKKENLGLNDVLDVEPGNVAVPYPDTNPNDNFSEEENIIEERDMENFQSVLDIIEQQSKFPIRPPVHPPTCRCRIVQEGKTFKWQTAGDDRVCDECNEYARQFNLLRNNII